MGITRMEHLFKSLGERVMGLRRGKQKLSKDEKLKVWLLRLPCYLCWLKNIEAYETGRTVTFMEAKTPGYRREQKHSYGQ